MSKATARLLMYKTRQLRGLWMCPRALIAQWLAGQAQKREKEEATCLFLHFVLDILVYIVLAVEWIEFKAR